MVSSAGAVCKSGVLVREGIGSALKRYFGRVDFSPIARTEMDFGKMRGEFDYKLALSKAYESARGGFLTPCEIFAPYYSFGIARWMLSRGLGKATRPTIIEFGGGTGSNANNVLDFLKSAAPEAYEKVRYVNVDISEPLADRAMKRNERHGDRFRSIPLHIDWQRSDLVPDDFLESEPVFVLALELLDNFPHDKVRFERKSHESAWTPTQQARVVVDEQGRPAEIFEELKDTYIQKAASILPSSSPPHQKKNSPITQFLKRIFGRRKEESELRRDVFVPTGALIWLENLKKAFPAHHLFVADFDALPPPTLPQNDQAINAPLVANPDGSDRPSYLDALDGSADIFFATDFSYLKRAYGITNNNNNTPIVKKAADFFRPYAHPCATRSGYNPLLADFTNTSVFMASTESPSTFQDDEEQQQLRR